MRSFLAVFMVIIVSGDDDETRNGVLEGSVLLPCACSERDLYTEFIWQMDKPNKTPVFKSNKTTAKFCGRYEGRASIFPPENCSLLLTNITVEDQGKYRCSFSIKDTYQKSFVNLHISANYTVCQTGNNLSKVYQCDVTGRYKEAQIQWNLDGKVLTNSTTTIITPTKNLDAPGFYRFSSTLSTKLNWTSEPTCDVKAEKISTNIRSACSGRADLNQRDPERDHLMRYRYLIIFPIMLVFGLSLFLKYRWNFSQSLPSTREGETDGSC